MENMCKRRMLEIVAFSWIVLFLFFVFISSRMLFFLICFPIVWLHFTYFVITATVYCRQRAFFWRCCHHCHHFSSALSYSTHTVHCFSISNRLERWKAAPFVNIYCNNIYLSRKEYTIVVYIYNIHIIYIEQWALGRIVFSFSFLSGNLVRCVFAIVRSSCSAHVVQERACLVYEFSCFFFLVVHFLFFSHCCIFHRIY